MSFLTAQNILVYKYTHEHTWTQYDSCKGGTMQEGKPLNPQWNLCLIAFEAYTLLCLHAESSNVPPDVTSSVPQDRNSRVEVSSSPVVKGMSRGSNRSSMMDTADGEHVIVCSTQQCILQ